VALAFSGPQPSQAGSDSTNQPTIVQHSPGGDTLIPPGDAKPCLRKPAGLASLKLIDAAAACSTRKQESSSPACGIDANAIALSFPGHGGGRAPPVLELV
jgi:hypothetical protein